MAGAPHSQTILYVCRSAVDAPTYVGPCGSTSPGDTKNDRDCPHPPLSDLAATWSPVSRAHSGATQKPRHCSRDFFPLTYVRAWDPAGTVVLYPSDHFVFPEKRFIETVRSAVLAAESLRNRVILLGIQPNCCELDYGWIAPGHLLSSQSSAPVQTIRRFLEKPCARQGGEVLEAGALWNTLVLTAKVQTLWELGWQKFSLSIRDFLSNDWAYC